MPIESRLVRTAPVLFTPKPCERDQKNALQCTDATQAPRHFVAVHSRHAYVQEDNRGHECCGNFQSRRPIMHHLNVMTPDPEERHEALGGVDAVVHDEDALGRHRRKSLAGRRRDIRSGGRVVKKRQADRKLAALIASCAFCVDATSMQFHNPMDESQADA